MAYPTSKPLESRSLANIGPCQGILLLWRASAYPTRTLSRSLLRPRQGTLPQPLPVPNELKEQPSLIWRRYDGIVVLRQLRRFRSHDTPTASIYRMCEFLCADESNQLMLEMQYFWNHSSAAWKLEAIPDPLDGDKGRYAIIAAIVESLVHAFNFRLKLGLRRGTEEQQEEYWPLWTSRVPALEIPLKLQRDEDIMFPESSSNPFSRRQIDANAGNLFSI